MRRRRRGSGEGPLLQAPLERPWPRPTAGTGGGPLVPAVASALSTSCSPRSCRLRARLCSRLPGDGPRLHHTGAPGERERGPRLVAGSCPHRAPRASTASPPRRGVPSPPRTAPAGERFRSRTSDSGTWGRHMCRGNCIPPAWFGRPGAVPGVGRTGPSDRRSAWASGSTKRVTLCALGKVYVRPRAKCLAPGDRGGLCPPRGYTLSPRGGRWGANSNQLLN